MSTAMKIASYGYGAQRVLTTAQLAEALDTTENIIQVNFSRNKERYVAGKHYFCLEGAELKGFLTTLQNVRSSNSRINKLYLWTEKGALLHAKSLNTGKAWEVYEQLVDDYYRLVKSPATPPLPLHRASCRSNRLRSALRGMPKRSCTCRTSTGAGTLMCFPTGAWCKPGRMICGTSPPLRNGYGASTSRNASPTTSATGSGIVDCQPRGNQKATLKS